MATDPLAPIERRQQRDISLLYRTLADSIRNAVADLPADQLATGADTGPILQAVEEGLDVIYGRFEGDQDAALRALVLRDADQARLLPLDEAVQGIRDALPAELLDLVDREAGR
jgi:hypothetical protein